MMEGEPHNPQVESERVEFEADAKAMSNVLEDDTLNTSKDSNTPFTGDQITSAKYGRHSLDQKTIKEEVVGGHHLTRRASLLAVIPSRYLSGSIGSCHDLCKAGHRHDSDEKTKSRLLRTQSERKDPPKEKSVFRHSGSLRRTEKPVISHRKVHPVNASRPSKPSMKRAMSMDAKTEPLKTYQKATLCEKQLPRSRRRSCIGTREGSKDSLFTKSILPILQKPFVPQSKHTPRSKQSVEPKVEKAEVEQSRDKGSSTWKRKLKEATIAALSSGIIGPKKPKSRRGENTNGDQNVEACDRKGNYKKKESDREEAHGKGSELGEVVLRHHETMGKKEDKETPIEPVKSRKTTVKTLVGAFEALISLGDRKRLVAASAS